MMTALPSLQCILPRLLHNLVQKVRGNKKDASDQSILYPYLYTYRTRGLSAKKVSA